MSRSPFDFSGILFAIVSLFICFFVFPSIEQGNSLDTKLTSMKQGSTVAYQSLQVSESPPVFVFLTDSVDDVKKRNSPVSSRSESPLSDTKSVILGCSPVQFSGPSRAHTDSDGLYDYPSSETVLTTSSPARRNTKKYERRRERKSNLQTSRNSKSGT